VSETSKSSRSAPNMTRRLFLIGGSVVAGVAATGLIVGAGWLASHDTEGLSGKIDEDGTARLNAYVWIRPDGSITLGVPRTEMGQGVFTGLATLIAEELEIDLDDPRVSVVHPVEQLAVYTNFMLALDGVRPEDQTGPVMWAQRKLFASFPYIGTGASVSTMGAWVSYRVAGASAREMLKSAAARRWAAPIDELVADRGFVVHAGSGQRAAYGDLAVEAAAMPPTRRPDLKPASEFRRIGRDIPRVDLRAKTRGEAIFGIDAGPPDCLYGAVAMGPLLGAGVASFDGRAARAARGVVDIVQGPDFIGVIADSWWRASKAAELLEIVWTGGDSTFSSETHAAAMRQVVATGATGKVRETLGDAQAALTIGALVTADYSAPLQVHAFMEPRGGTALFHVDGTAEMWGSAQSPLALRWGAEGGAELAGIKIKGDVVCHVAMTGGGFGGRSEKREFVQAAVMAARVPGRAVKLIWTRQQDIQHGVYRSHAAARLEARLNDDGAPLAFRAHVAAQALQESFALRNLPQMAGGDLMDDEFGIEGLANLPYEIPNVEVRFTHMQTPVQIGFWRCNGHSFNVYFAETFIDEMARAAGRDPLEYRIAYAKDKRGRKVLERLKDLSGWGVPLPEGWARGVAFKPSFESFVGQVAEVSVAADGAIQVERVVAVVDCGVVVNPDIVRSQIEGSIVWGLTAGYQGGITYRDGVVEQSSFADYPVTMMKTAPRRIEVHIVESAERPGGVGEPGTPPIAPAVANAIFAATGKRLRELPIQLLA